MANSVPRTPAALADVFVAALSTTEGKAASKLTDADLAALVRPSGAVFLDWTGPTGGSLRYEVQTLGLDEDGGEWTRLGAASATDDTDREAAPGERRSYRVQAVRGERTGEFSNVASSNP